MSPTSAVREMSPASSISRLSEPTLQVNTGEACSLTGDWEGVAVCGKALEDAPEEPAEVKTLAIPVQKEPQLKEGDPPGELD